MTLSGSIPVRKQITASFFRYFIRWNLFSRPVRSAAIFPPIFVFFILPHFLFPRPRGRLFFCQETGPEGFLSSCLYFSGEEPKYSRKLWQK